MQPRCLACLEFRLSSAAVFISPQDLQQVAFNSDTLKPTKELSEGAGEAKASISTCSLT
jgi:hypothetical protein